MSNDQYILPGLGSTISPHTVAIEQGFPECEHFVLGRIGIYIKVQRREKTAILGASAGCDISKVRIRAFAEFVERCSAYIEGYNPNRELVYGTVNELTNCFDGTVVSPKSLRHFADSQKIKCLLEEPTHNSLITWCKGYCPSNNSSALVPALATFAKWMRPINEPLFIKPDATGLAANPDETLAIQHAILEVLERHTLLMSWRKPGWPTYQVDLALVPPRLINICETLGLVLAIYLLTLTDLPPTILALVSRPNKTEVTCGSACGLFTPATIEKAVSEALMVRWTICYSAEARQYKETLSVQNWQSYIPHTSLGHVIRAFHCGDSVTSWYQQQSVSCGNPSLKFDKIVQCFNNVAQLATDVEQTLGGNVVIVDVTDRNAQNIGWFVCRAIISNALPRESDHRVACLGGPHLSQERNVHLEPHPFG